MATQNIVFDGGPWNGQRTAVHKPDVEPLFRFAERTDRHFTDEDQIGIARYLATDQERMVDVTHEYRSGPKVKSEKHQVYTYVETIVRDRATLQLVAVERPAYG